MAHVFISFVEENAKLAGWIASQMRANGLDPWFSKDIGRIIPGEQWRETLRNAIREGGFYAPVFTKEWAQRTRTVANEELTVAIEEARQRGLHRRWFIPLKIDDQPLPNISLGAGICLTDLQYVDFPQLGWERGLRVMLQALGVANPAVETGEPLAPGFGATAEVVGGFVTYRNTNPPVAEIEGVTFTATAGRLRRGDDGGIYGSFHLRAPYEELQCINVELGLDRVDVRTDDQDISTDPARLTHFYYFDEKDRRGPGSPLWELGAKKPVHTDVSMEQQTGYDAYGYLRADDRVVGHFNGYVETRTVLGTVRFTFDGDFEFAVRTAVAPPDE